MWFGFECRFVACGCRCNSSIFNRDVDEDEPQERRASSRNQPFAHGLADWFTLVCIRSSSLLLGIEATIEQNHFQALHSAHQEGNNDAVHTIPCGEHAAPAAGQRLAALAGVANAARTDAEQELSDGVEEDGYAGMKILELFKHGMVADIRYRKRSTLVYRPETRYSTLNSELTNTPTPAHTVSQRLRTLKKVPPELIPLGVVLAAALIAAGYSIVRKFYTDKTLRLTRQGPQGSH